MLPRAFALALCLGFVACAAPVASLFLPDPITEIASMDVRFSFPEPLTVHTFEDEAMLSGVHAAVHVESGSYRTVPGLGIDDMPVLAVPREVADAVREKRSCTPLRGKVMLPVDTSRPFLCDLVLDPAGRVVVWMIGLGRPFQDLPFLQSSVAVFDEKRVIAFSYLTAFPEADATTRWLVETFPDRHPGLSALIWPNRSYKLLSDEIISALLPLVEPPSAEVAEAMELLERVAFSVDRARPVLPE